MLIALRSHSLYSSFFLSNSLSSCLSSSFPTTLALPLSSRYRKSTLSFLLALSLSLSHALSFFPPLSFSLFLVLSPKNTHIQTC